MSTLADERRSDAPDILPDVLAACKKRSFLELPVQIDMDRLLEEFHRIPDEAWGDSLWDAHCSIDMLLLRGGAKGNEEDFTTTDVSNNPLLADFPYISSLLAPEGPFGGTTYGFIFRTKPGGMTRVHTDDHESWTRNVRVHIPIISNEGAVLMSEGRSLHFAVGGVWTFDNQAVHSVMNGDTTRVHMIIDVMPNPKLAALMSSATFHAGEEDPVRWKATHWHGWTYKFARSAPLGRQEKLDMGLDPDGFASRVTSIQRIAKLAGACPLRTGDIVAAANGIASSNISRSPLDLVHETMSPGDVVKFDILRDSKRKTVRVRLVADNHFMLKSRAMNVLKRLFGKVAPGAKAWSTGY
tara:strand:- start:1401 stop:2462 length:1062 start_codon:yes stop_codon:yes gene_type:complete